MIEGITFDTFFLFLITLFSGIILPMIKKYLDCLRQVVKRVELLEFIAISQHPDLVKKFKEIKK